MIPPLPPGVPVWTPPKKACDYIDPPFYTEDTFLNAPDLTRFVAFDFETFRFRPGEMAPPVVCASAAWYESDGTMQGKLLAEDEALAFLESLLRGDRVIVFANASYDLAVALAAREDLFWLVYKALEERRIYDILTAQSLNDIYCGHLGKMRDGSDLRIPGSNKPSKRYSLEIVTYLLTGRVDAKSNDIFRKSYALLKPFPIEQWPEVAQVYPVDDARNTLQAAVIQILGKPGEHEFVAVATEASEAFRQIKTSCRLCGEELGFSEATPYCPKAVRTPHRNLENLPFQVEASLALNLGACWGLRTFREKVDALEAYCNEKHEAMVTRFQKKGWIRTGQHAWKIVGDSSHCTRCGASSMAVELNSRCALDPEDGTEDQAAVKRAIVEAYGGGMAGRCSRCDGKGKYQPMILVDCRGEKVKGRYQGCFGTACLVCGGFSKVQKLAPEKTCKNVYNEAGELVEKGCDGTGYDLDDVGKLLPRSEKLGVRTDRDALLESGDEDLADYGENEFEKSRSTYLPYLKKGLDQPLTYGSNVLVASGRVSYEGTPLHQMPRSGMERKTIRARGRWCGSLKEYVLGSTDYEAGELCTLAQLTYWLFKESKMRDAINASGKPGILHSDLAAEVLGIPLDEFLKKLKAKDKQCADTRQMCKPISFGKPGGMGTAKLVLTARKKNSGFTESPSGPAINNGKRGYWGVRFCILTGSTHCGVKKTTRFNTKHDHAPVCQQCCEVVEDMLTPAYFRRYPEVKLYYEWGSRTIKEAEKRGQIPRAPTGIWSPKLGRPVVIRQRGFINEELGVYSALLNNGFQSLLSDVGKLAFMRATRECYTGMKPDGSPSPLAGSRLPIYIHDEPLSELLLDNAHVAGPRIAEIMVEAGREYAPDVAWAAETAISFLWDKGMEPVYSDGKLVPWGWIPDEHKDRFARAA